MVSIKKIAILISLFLVKITGFSQCAMCKAVVESDLQSGGSVGKGINDGIIYLMIIPYLLMAVVGYFVYKHYKKNKVSKSV